MIFITTNCFTNKTMIRVLPRHFKNANLLTPLRLGIVNRLWSSSIPNRKLSNTAPRNEENIDIKIVTKPGAKSSTETDAEPTTKPSADDKVESSTSASIASHGATEREYPDDVKRMDKIFTTICSVVLVFLLIRIYYQFTEFRERERKKKDSMDDNS